MIAYYETVKQTGRAALLEKRRAEEAEAARNKTARAKGMEPQVRQVIAALDAQGRWIEDFRGSAQILTKTFIANLRLLCDYLEATK